jgi:CDP-paratose 2-epimerase
MERIGRDNWSWPSTVKRRTEVTISLALITGSAVLIGSEASRYLADVGYDVVGIDNDLRSTFLGPNVAICWQRNDLQKILRKNIVTVTSIFAMRKALKEQF